MKNILIIEDDKHLNKGLSIALEKNYGVISTFSIIESKKHISDSDLILLDMNLPDGDGIEIIKYTRETSAIPIIVLSAIDLEAYIISAINLGADDYLTKPFSLGILEAKIKRAFEKIPACNSKYTDLWDQPICEVPKKQWNSGGFPASSCAVPAETISQQYNLKTGL